MYADWSTLATKLIIIPVTTTKIIVWPDRMRESRHMHQIQIGLERNLQYLIIYLCAKGRSSTTIQHNNGEQ